MSATAATLRCHVCSAGGVALLHEYERMFRVTSDCKPWPQGGRLCQCQSCGVVQKPIDPAWQSEIDAIYKSYTIYYQSRGAEQAVFDTSSGQPSARSGRLVEFLRSR